MGSENDRTRRKWSCLLLDSSYRGLTSSQQYSPYGPRPTPVQSLFISHPRWLRPSYNVISDPETPLVMAWTLPFCGWGENALALLVGFAQLTPVNLVVSDNPKILSPASLRVWVLTALSLCLPPSPASSPGPSNPPCTCMASSQCGTAVWSAFSHTSNSSVDLSQSLSQAW